MVHFIHTLAPAPLSGPAVVQDWGLSSSLVDWGCIPMHGLQAESEIFRLGACCDQDEEAFEEHKRRQRLERKAQEAPKKGQAPPTVFSKPQLTNVQTLLEAEHRERQMLRANLVECQARLDACVRAALTGAGHVSEPVSAAEWRAVAKENERILGEQQTEFVQSYR